MHCQALVAGEITCGQPEEKNRHDPTGFVRELDKITGKSSENDEITTGRVYIKIVIKVVENLYYM